MSTHAARVGATLLDGAPLLGRAVAQALEHELVNEPHGPIEVHVFGGDEARRALEMMGVRPDSPAREFLAHYAEGVLVVAMAEVGA